MELPYYTVEAPTHLHRAGLDLWRDSRRDMYDVASLTGDFGDCFFRMAAYRVDSIIFTEAQCCNLFISRRRRHLDNEGAGFVYLFFARGTQYLRSPDGEQANSTTDKLTIVDYAQAVDLSLQDCSQIAVFVPHAMIGCQPGHMPRQMSIGLDGATGRILQDAMTATFDELPRTASNDAESVASGFAGLLEGLLSGGAMSQNETTFQSARGRSMREYLERRLQDPNLDVTALERGFGASRATIFRDFAEYGGVAHYIKTRRLERAFSDLADNAPVRGAVTKAAQRWGFPNISEFSRAFRTHFGHAPSSAVGLRAESALSASGDVIGKAAALEGVRGDPYNLQKWLAHIGSR